MSLQAFQPGDRVRGVFLESVKEAPCRLFFNVCFGTYGLFEEYSVGMLRGGGSPECPNCKTFNELI